MSNSCAVLAKLKVIKEHSLWTTTQQRTQSQRTEQIVQSEMIPQMPPLIPIYKLQRSYHHHLVPHQQADEVSSGNVSVKAERKMTTHLENQKQRTASLKRSSSVMDIKTSVSHLRKPLYISCYETYNRSARVLFYHVTYRVSQKKLKSVFSCGTQLNI